MLETLKEIRLALEAKSAHLKSVDGDMLRIIDLATRAAEIGAEELEAQKRGDAKTAAQKERARLALTEELETIKTRIGFAEIMKSVREGDVLEAKKRALIAQNN